MPNPWGRISLGTAGPREDQCAWSLVSQGRGLAGEFRGRGRGCFLLGLQDFVRTPLFQDMREAVENF